MPLLAQLDAILSNPSWEILLCAFLLISIFFYTLSVKKGKSITLFISFYLAIFIFSNFPYFNIIIPGNLKSIDFFLFRLFLFAILILIFNIFLIKIGVSEGASSRSGWIEATLFSLLGTALIMSFLFHFFNINSVFEFSAALKYLFFSDIPIFWWIILPFPAIFFFRR